MEMVGRGGGEGEMIGTLCDADHTESVLNDFRRRDAKFAQNAVVLLFSTFILLSGGRGEGGGPGALSPHILKPMLETQRRFVD